MAGVTDKYANILHDTVTMSAPNVLTFREIDIGLNLFDKAGILIHRIQADPNAIYQADMLTSADWAKFALVQSNSITTLDITERSVIDLVEQIVTTHGAPASSQVVDIPLVRDYTSLPGGGILIAPKPLYWAVQTAGFASALVAAFRLYFTIVKLKDSDYLELLESRRFFG